MGGLAISIPEDLPDSKQFVPSWSCGTWFVKQGGLHLLFNNDRETVKEEILSLSKEDIESKILFQDFTDHHFSLLELTSADRSEYVTNPEFHRDRYDEQDLVRVGPGQVVPGTKLRLKTVPQLKAFWDDQSAYTPPVPSLDLTKQDLTRLKMAEAAYQAYIGHDNYTTEELKFSPWTFRRHCGDWPKRPEGDLATPFGFSCAALIYGGLHVLAWFAHFNSTTEQLLWRISSCVVMGGLPILFINQFRIDQLLGYYSFFWSMIFKFGISYYTRLFRRLPTNTQVATFILCLTIEFVVFPIYVLARAYLVVECFMQLSHLPAGVYNVPEWSTYFPHIS
ncbi:MAG: hypothetical protein L6R35_005773 [Caloplaca aegaea]|nr:MAG: hypothetical protein L6R35_005773 [Caloplaca aegaea]